MSKGRRDFCASEGGRGKRVFEVGYLSPLGPMRIRGWVSAILEVDFCETEIASVDDSVPNVLLACRLQFEEYFRGKRRVFDLKLEPQGTAFQRRIWSRLLCIPYGETRSYKDIASDAGNRQAARAVGAANARNPIGIIIPCHRVIGTRGDLVGYGGGLWRKQWLLNHERSTGLRDASD